MLVWIFCSINATKIAAGLDLIIAYSQRATDRPDSRLTHVILDFLGRTCSSYYSLQFHYSVLLSDLPHHRGLDHYYVSFSLLLENSFHGLLLVEA